ncbi:MAG TPA: RNA methyltransferase, partial [Pyrinomonadaceae bacterium]
MKRGSGHKGRGTDAARRGRSDSAFRSERGASAAPKSERKSERAANDVAPESVRKATPTTKNERAPVAATKGARPQQTSSQSVNAAPAAQDGGARLYGVAPVLEALRAGQRPLEQITIAEGAQSFRMRELLELAHRLSVPVRRAPRAELERITGAGVNHQGIVAIIAAARYSDADEFLDSLTARIGTADPPLAVVLDGVEDPRNLGAIIRTVECAGAHGVLIPERRAVGLTEVVAKTAAGALEHVPVARAANLTRLIEQLKERNIWTIGTSGDAGLEYTDWDFTQATALVLGGEGS